MLTSLELRDGILDSFEGAFFDGIHSTNLGRDELPSFFCDGRVSGHIFEHRFVGFVKIQKEEDNSEAASKETHSW